MWRPISSASGRLAVPLKSLKRLSSLRLRAFLRSGAGFGVLGLGAVLLGSLWRQLLARAVGLGVRPVFRLLVFHHHCSRFHSDSPQAGWLWLFFGSRTQKLAGRPGFEPGQVPPKGTVLPLDDRPSSSSRPRVSPAERTPVNAKACRANRPRAAGCWSNESQRPLAAAVRKPPLHSRGSGTTRRAPNRTPTARHGGLPPECPKPQEDA